MFTTGQKNTAYSPAAPLRVLVADDDPDLVAMCSSVLEYEGYSIDIARNGVEALEAVSRAEADVVLLDVMMPVVDGLTVCRMLKRDPHTRSLPVIIMSASESLCEKAKHALADAVISKPFDIDRLVDTVRQLASH